MAAIAKYTVDHLSSLIVRAASNPEVQKDAGLAKTLRDKLVELMKRSPFDPLSNQDLSFYIWTQEQLEEKNKVNAVATQALKRQDQAVQTEPVRNPEAEHMQSMLNVVLRLEPSKLPLILAMLKAIALNPKNSKAYYNLANALPTDGSIELLDGSKTTQQELFLKAFSLDRNNSSALIAYYQFGNLPPGNSIQLPDGTMMTKQDLYKIVINLDPQNLMAYADLLYSLSLGETTELLNGTKIHQLQILAKVVEFLESRDSRERNRPVFLNVIRHNPKNALAYLLLGATYHSQKDSIELLDGTKMTDRQLCLKSLDLDPQPLTCAYSLTFFHSGVDSIPLLNGTTMTGEQLRAMVSEYSCIFAQTLPLAGITLNNHQTVTQQMVYREAIKLDCKNAMAYAGLGFTLSFGETTELNDGTKMHQYQLFQKARELDPQVFLKAIRNNPKNAMAYYLLAAMHTGSSDTIQLLDGTKMTRVQLCLKSIDLDPSSIAYLTLLGTFPSEADRIILLNGTRMTKQQLRAKISEIFCALAHTLHGNRIGAIKWGSGEAYSEVNEQDLYRLALSFDPSNAETYYDLATTLSWRGSITLLDGTEMTKQKLYVKVISLNPHHTAAYYKLADDLSWRGSVKLLDDSEMTDQQLYLKVISLDPDHSKAYYKLARYLDSKDSIILLDGSKMTKQQLYVKVISLDPKNSDAHEGLGRSLPTGGKITLLDGTEMTKQQLYLQAISLDPSSDYYDSLATTLPTGGSITLLDGTEMTQQQLYLKSISSGNYVKLLDYYKLWNFSPGSSIELRGKKLTQQQLYLEIIAMDSYESEAYSDLGATLPKGGSIKLLDGTNMTKEQLYIKAVNITRKNAKACSYLASTLPTGGSIQLLNGSTMTKEQLMQKGNGA